MGNQRTAIRPAPGTYALILACRQERAIEIGRLGRIELRPGIYVYVGSAFGPGGLRARLAHHLRQALRPHWHLDYLRPHVRPLRVWCAQGEARHEHQWARLIGSLPGASIPLARFGASDCGCPSHLFYFETCPSRVALDASRGRRGQQAANTAPHPERARSRPG